jgi:hypothetical protein
MGHIRGTRLRFSPDGHFFIFTQRHGLYIKVVRHFSLGKFKRSNQMQNINREQVTDVHILGLLKKYGLILIIYEAIRQYGLIFITRYYFGTFHHDHLSNLNDINFVLLTATILTCNLIIGLIMLYDLNKTKLLTWILFLLAVFFAPWTSLTFVLIWKVVEMKNNAQQSA